MNLLVLNPKTDRRDSGLEVAVEWLEALAARVDTIQVITNEAGELPSASNVVVRSLGREQGKTRPERVVTFYRHLWSVVSARPVDACFVHMVPQFAVMAAPVLKLKGVPMVQWYTHRATPWSLRIAHQLVNRVVTASAESFRIPSSKVLITGHGINTTRFSPGAGTCEMPKPPRILTVGRLSRAKRVDILIDAVEALDHEGFSCQLDIVGEGRDEAGRAYAAMLERAILERRLNHLVRFHGSLGRDRLVDWYRQSAVFVNLSETGSIDKAVLEAMACGLPVITSNPAFRTLLRDCPSLLVEHASASAVAERIRQIVQTPATERARIGAVLRRLVVDGHDLNAFADNLVQLFGQLIRQKRANG